jgi:hypothetical protein
MLTHTSRWSHARGNTAVPSRWQATAPRAGWTISNMAETLSKADRDEPWVKIVGKREVLMPTLDLVRASVEAADDKTSVLDVRQALAEQFGLDTSCPVTVRRHLQTLGIPVRRGTDLVKPRP